MDVLEFVRAYLACRIRSERAATLVEYVLLLSLIAVICFAAVTSIGNKVSGSFNSTSGKL